MGLLFNTQWDMSDRAWNLGAVLPDAFSTKKSLWIKKSFGDHSEFPFESVIHHCHLTIMQIMEGFNVDAKQGAMGKFLTDQSREMKYLLPLCRPILPRRGEPYQRWRLRDANNICKTKYSTASVQATSYKNNACATIPLLCRHKMQIFRLNSM